jgi:hypothetical protein
MRCNIVDIDRKKGKPAMGVPKMRAEDVEALAESLGVVLKPGNSETIAPMLSEIRQSVYRKGVALKQDAPLSVYFDAR